MSMMLETPNENRESRELISPPASRSVVPARWRQPRFLLGLALMSLSVLLGATLFGAADDRVTVWTLVRDLAPGSVITAGDLTPSSVHVPSAGTYVAADTQAVIGRRVTIALAAGQLLPASAVGSSETTKRLVTVPVEPIHAPTDLAHGDQVDVYVSPRDSVTSGVSRLVAAKVLVADVAADIDSAAGEFAVILEVDPSQVASLVNASRGGVLDLVAVPTGAP